LFAEAADSVESQVVHVCSELSAALINLTLAAVGVAPAFTVSVDVPALTE